MMPQAAPDAGDLPFTKEQAAFRSKWAEAITEEGVSILIASAKASTFAREWDCVEGRRPSDDGVEVLSTLQGPSLFLIYHMTARNVPLRHRLNTVYTIRTHFGLQSAVGIHENVEIDAAATSAATLIVRICGDQASRVQFRIDLIAALQQASRGRGRRRARSDASITTAALAVGFAFVAAASFHGGSIMLMVREMKEFGDRPPSQLPLLRKLARLEPFSFTLHGVCVLSTFQFIHGGRSTSQAAASIKDLVAGLVKKPSRFRLTGAQAEALWKALAEVHWHRVIGTAGGTAGGTASTIAQQAAVPDQTKPLASKSGHSFGSLFEQRTSAGGTAMQAAAKVSRERRDECHFPSIKPHHVELTFTAVAEQRHPASGTYSRTSDGKTYICVGGAFSLVFQRQMWTLVPADASSDSAGSILGFKGRKEDGAMFDGLWQIDSKHWMCATVKRHGATGILPLASVKGGGGGAKSRGGRR